MKTALEILQKAGGWRQNLHIKIVNPPYLALVIQSIEAPGPLGLPVLSIMHKSIVSNLKFHPEMRFEVATVRDNEITLDPFYWRHDFIPAEQFSRFNRNDEYVCLVEMHHRHIRFASDWDSLLAGQGITEAFESSFVLS